MRYQNGTLEEVHTKRGIVWFIRFTNPDGTRPRVEVGTKAHLPTKAKASRAAQHLRDEFNGRANVSHTMADVIAKYELTEIPEEYSTGRGYRGIHKNHIMPRWGAVNLDEISALKVREWILGMDKAGKTKGNILGQMRVLYKFAMLWEWVPATANLMSLFSIKGSTKRKRTPRIIKPAQFLQIVNLAPDVTTRAMIYGAYCLGLRASELFGLKWRDIDFFEHKVHIQRKIVDGRVGKVKTPSSEAKLPFPPECAKAFMDHFSTALYRDSDDWVFASAAQGGELPFNSQHIQYNTLRGIGVAVGLDFNLGWHTFRHSLKNLLKASGSDSEMARDILRHSDTHMTDNVYGEPDFERMKTASERAMQMIFGNHSDAHNMPKSDILR